MITIKVVYIMHQHDEHCNCGGDHSEHHHEHDENCGCGHTHAPTPTREGLTPVQVDILLALRQRKCLPVACFSFAKTGNDTLRSVALAPVYLSTASDSMEQVKQLGQELSQLEDMDLLTLDYDMPLNNYAYEEYKTSVLYAYFVKTVEEGAQRPNATCDIAKLELGSMALTEIGDNMVDELIK